MKRTISLVVDNNVEIASDVVLLCETLVLEAQKDSPCCRIGGLSFDEIAGSEVGELTDSYSGEKVEKTFDRAISITLEYFPE